MKIQVLNKKNGAQREIDDLRGLVLNEPSVIFLKLAPENVARYERRGDDLVLVLKDGQEITIPRFFVKYPEAQGDAAAVDGDKDVAADQEEPSRNELVLIDDNNVVWWGQYPEQWSEFHFTEIDWDFAPAAAWWPWLLGALGGIGAGVAVLGGKKNSPPVAVDDSATGTEDGGPITGTVLGNDSDPDQDVVTVTSYTINGVTYTPNQEAVIEGIGTFTMTPNGEYVFTPEENWNGTVPPIGYKISDGREGVDDAVLTIIVTPVNDAPVEVSPPVDEKNQNSLDAENIELDISVWFEDVDTNDQNPDELSYDATGLPPGLTINPETGVISGTIDNSASVVGDFIVVVSVTDRAGATTSVTINWTVNNPDPIAYDDYAIGLEDGDAVTGNVLVRDPNDDDDQNVTDVDPDGDDLLVTQFVINDTIYLIDEAMPVAVEIDGDKIGDFSMDENGDYVFTPVDDWSGDVPPIVYTISDGEGGTSTATLTIVIDSVNDAPTADDVTDAVKEAGIQPNVGGDPSGDNIPETTSKSTATGNVVTGSTEDVEGDTLTVTTISFGNVSVAAGEPLNGAYGQLTIDSDGNYNYVLDEERAESLPQGKPVPEVFVYTLSDGKGGTVDAQLTITVEGTNDKPVIVDDQLTDTVTEAGVEDEQGKPTATGTLRATDPDEDATQTWRLVDGTTQTQTVEGIYGSIELDATTGVWTYKLDNDRPATQALDTGGEPGIEEFDVLVKDGLGGTDTKKIIITVNGANDAPTADDISVDVKEAGIRFNDTATIDDDNQAEAGVSTVSGNVVIDGVNDAEVDTVTVTKIAAGADEPVAVADTEQSVSGIYGTLTIESDGRYRYVLDNSRPATQQLVHEQTEQDVFTYTVSDGKGGVTTATLSFNIAGTNDQPIIDESYLTGNTVAAGRAGVSKAEAVGQLESDDPDTGATATWALVDGTGAEVLTIKGTFGDITLNATTGEWTYLLDDARPETIALSLDQVELEEFDVIVRDGLGGSDTATITVSVFGSNDAPTTGVVVNSVTEAGLAPNSTPTPFDDNVPFAGTPSTSGNVMTQGGSADIDNDVLIVSDIAVGANPSETVGRTGITVTGLYGTLTINPNGGYTYNLNNDFPATQELALGKTGSDIFTYTVSDDKGGFAESTLTIIVTGTNDQPLIDTEISELSGSVTESGTSGVGVPSVSGTLVSKDPDLNPDGNPDPVWTLLNNSNQEVQTINGVYGSITLNSATGEWTYSIDNNATATQKLPAGAVRTESFTVAVKDTLGGSDRQTITVTINGGNDAPTATNSTNSVTEAGLVFNTTPTVNDDNQPLAGTAVVTGNVVTGGLTADIDGDALTVTQIAAGAPENAAVGEVDSLIVGPQGQEVTGTYGTLIINPNGSYSYSLDNGLTATQSLARGTSADDIFTYTVSDGKGGTVEATLTITVNGTNDQPIISDTQNGLSGSVTEVGAVVAGQSTVSGTVTAVDPDAGATQLWTLVDGSTEKLTITGIYGDIVLNAATGVWTYTLDNNRPATQALNAGDAPATETFSVRVKDGLGGSDDAVISLSVNGSNDVMTGKGDASLTLVEDTKLVDDNPVASNGALFTGTLQDHVQDVDNTPSLQSVTYEGANGPVTVTLGTAMQLTDANNVPYATLLVNVDGSYSLQVVPHYSGELPTLTYVMKEMAGDQVEIEQKLAFDVTPVSDAPILGSNKKVITNEDTTVALDLTVPVIVDTGTSVPRGDYSELLGVITLNVPVASGGVIQLADGTPLVVDDAGNVQIVLVDADGNVLDLHHAGLTTASAPNLLTREEYEALTFEPKANSGDNVNVTVSVTSYEVDEDGLILTGVPGASSSQIITVDVKAVTDAAVLTPPAVSILQVNEDAILDITSSIIPVPSADTDGSEDYRYGVSGLPIGSVVTIGGTSYAITAANPVATGVWRDDLSPPTITIKPPVNFSGDMSGVKVILQTRDADTDSNGHKGGVETSTINLTIGVLPIAGDLAVANVSTTEDIAVAFLAGVSVTDTGMANGTEVIDSLSFTIPTGWTMTAPTGTGFTVTGGSGIPTVITFDTGLTQGERETLLDGFMITPPAHDSRDVTIPLSITTTDTKIVGSETRSSTVVTTDRSVTVTVRPDAEETTIDSDKDGANDLTLLPSHIYTTAGKEDEWFALGTNDTDAANDGANHVLRAGWSNEDSGEYVYAQLTPTIQSDDMNNSAIGAEFRFFNTETGQWVTQTYVGTPLLVPEIYLNSLQVKLPENASGTMSLAVQAVTVDYDDDTAVKPDVWAAVADGLPTSNNSVNVATSGSATLTMIKFEGVADDVTMSVNSRLSWFEDQLTPGTTERAPIPLTVTVSSTDSSESFVVKLSEIPSGSILYYGGTAVPVVGGVATIDNFDNDVPLTILPPEHSNADFQLTVTAQSKDGASLSEEVQQSIYVDMIGVADRTIITTADYSVTEVSLDNGDNKVNLSKIITNFVSADTDGSENVTLRITGLKADFNLEGATLLGAGTGENRVWTITPAQLANVKISLPENYSGKVDFQVAGVTTEKSDGSTLTGAYQPVSFDVTASPEGIATNSATLVEDEITSLGIQLLTQNGDDDEQMGQIFIDEVQAVTADYDLYFDNKLLAESTLVKVGGVYIVPAGEAGKLSALAKPNADGTLPNVTFRYEVIDTPSDGSPAVVEVKDGSIALTVTPVTDDVTASLPQSAVSWTAAGDYIVNVVASSVDQDGSEMVTRVILSGVPEGVTVLNAAQVGVGANAVWILEGAALPASGMGVGGLTIPVTFKVGPVVTNGDADIKITVQAQDRATQMVKEDEVSLDLTLTLTGGDGDLPPIITTWEPKDETGVEDERFSLYDKIAATVTPQEAPNADLDYRYTVTLTDEQGSTYLADSVIEGMTVSTIGGITYYTASVAVNSQLSSQDALDALMQTIKITPPENSNSGNSDFSFNTALTASVIGGISNSSDLVLDMNITPVTDAASISVTATDANEGVSSVSAAIEIGVGVDGDRGEIVGGFAYIRVDAPNNLGGTVKINGVEAIAVINPVVPGLPAGTYYQVPVTAAGGDVTVTYEVAGANGLQPDAVNFTVWAQTQELGAGNVLLTSNSAAANVALINNGVTITPPAALIGTESPVVESSNAIVLTSKAPDADESTRTGLQIALNDNDGSESLRTIMLSGVPTGFLIYVGETEATARLASKGSNAGGSDANNIWILSTDGVLPNYVSILPPVHWSGTLTDLTAIVTSGEKTGLAETKTESLALGEVTVTPQANGLTITPTRSFGAEGQIIKLNLNPAMVDQLPAKAGVADSSTELAALTITGLGPLAAFYIGTTLLTDVAYDDATKTYRIIGLTQDDLFNLGYVQSRDAIIDQIPGTAGNQISVTAWTYESDGGDSSTPVTSRVNVDVTRPIATTGNDSFLFGNKAINGLAGQDTVKLRINEDVSADSLAGLLRNIETIDMSALGGNAITDGGVAGNGLSLADVVAITGRANGTLTFNGTAEDSVILSSATEWTSGTDQSGYDIYTSGNVTLRIDEDMIVTFSA